MKGMRLREHGAADRTVPAVLWESHCALVLACAVGTCVPPALACHYWCGPFSLDLLASPFRLELLRPAKQPSMTRCVCKQPRSTSPDRPRGIVHCITLRAEYFECDKDLSPPAQQQQQAANSQCDGKSESQCIYPTCVWCVSAAVPSACYTPVSPDLRMATLGREPTGLNVVGRPQSAKAEW